jgi:pyruvate dehydrogenase E2 component (dihydrolipoamide acetyltransferase)
MATDVIMPALGMAQETGKLIRWLKRDGENVTKGEPLMEVETDKATVEVEAPATGVLSGISAAEGDDVPVGRAIAVILAAGETAAAPAPRASASPKAKRLAAERGIDITKVEGSGPGGAVLEEDVLLAAGPLPNPVPPSGRGDLWKAMAQNVTRSWRDAPHFFVMREVDASALVAFRSRGPEGVTYTDLLVRAVAAALARHPRMNGGKPEVNIGLAVAVPDGLLVPVLHGADDLSLGDISASRRDLLERVQSNRMRANDLSGATFTISNLGMYGVDVFTAILIEGQAGILAVGRITDRVVARDGAPAVRPVMLMSLSCDHRLVDGARAAEFMQTLVEQLEKAPD